MSTAGVEMSEDSNDKPRADRRVAPDYERSFGQHLRSLRKARGLTQEVLAERSGLSADTIRRLEHGSFSPSLSTLRSLCRGFKLQMSTLFLGHELCERDVSREILDALMWLTDEEREGLLRLVNVLGSILESSRG